MGCFLCKMVEDLFGTIQTPSNSHYSMYVSENIRKRVFNSFFHYNKRKLENPLFIEQVISLFDFNVQSLMRNVKKFHGNEPAHDEMSNQRYLCYIETRIVNIYKSYAPDRIQKEGTGFVRQLMQSNRNNETNLIKRIVEKYGPEHVSIIFPLSCDRVKFQPITLSFPQQPLPPPPSILQPVPLPPPIPPMTLSLHGGENEMIERKRQIEDHNGGQKEKGEKICSDDEIDEIVFDDFPGASENESEWDIIAENNMFF